MSAGPRPIVCVYVCSAGVGPLNHQAAIAICSDSNLTKSFCDVPQVEQVVPVINASLCVCSHRVSALHHLWY